MAITLAIRRYNPDTGKKPYWQEYTTSVEPTDRVLDALMDIKRNQDGSLAFRKSCRRHIKARRDEKGESTRQSSESTPAESTPGGTE